MNSLKGLIYKVFYLFAYLFALLVTRKTNLITGGLTEKGNTGGKIVSYELDIYESPSLRPESGFPVVENPTLILMIL